MAVVRRRLSKGPRIVSRTGVSVGQVACRTFLSVCRTVLQKILHCQLVRTAWAQHVSVSNMKLAGHVVPAVCSGHAVLKRTYHDHLPCFLESRYGNCHCCCSQGADVGCNHLWMKERRKRSVPCVTSPPVPPSLMVVLHVRRVVHWSPGFQGLSAASRNGCSNFSRFGREQHTYITADLRGVHTANKEETRKEDV